MSSKIEETQQLVHTITSYAEWTADEKDGLEFSFFMDGQTIPRYVDLSVKDEDRDNAVQDRLHLDPTEYAFEDNFKVYDLDKEALGHLLAIVADRQDPQRDPNQVQKEAPLVTLSRQTYDLIDRHEATSSVPNNHLTNVVNFMNKKWTALDGKEKSPYYCSCMVTNGNKFIAQANGDACAFFYFERALYPLINNSNLKLEDKDADGNLLNSFHAYCDTDVIKAHTSKVIPVLENSVVILCNVPLFESLGQMDLIKIVHSCAYTDNIAQALVKEAYKRHPERSYQAASLYFLSAAESDSLKSRIRDLLRRPHESLGRTSLQEQESRPEDAVLTAHTVAAEENVDLSPSPAGQVGDRPKQEPFVSRPEGSDRQASGRRVPDRGVSDRGVSDRGVSDRRVPDRGVSDRGGPDRIHDQVDNQNVNSPSSHSQDPASGQNPPLEQSSDYALRRPLERPPDGAKTRIKPPGLSHTDEESVNPPPRRVPPPPPPPRKPVRSADNEKKLQTASSALVPPQGEGALLESDKYEPKSPSDRTREFSRSPFESRELGLGEDTGQDPTKNIKDVLKSTELSPDVDKKTADIVKDPPLAQPQEQGRAKYEIRRKSKKSPSTNRSDKPIPSNQQAPRVQPSTSAELPSDTLTPRRTNKLVSSSVDHNAVPTNGEMEKIMENTDKYGIIKSAYPNKQTDSTTDRQNTVPSTKDPQLVVKVDLSFPLGEVGYDQYEMYHYEDGAVVTQTGHVILTAEDFVARQQALQQGGAVAVESANPVQVPNDYGAYPSEDLHDDNAGVRTESGYDDVQGSGTSRSRQPSLTGQDSNFYDNRSEYPYDKHGQDGWTKSTNGGYDQDPAGGGYYQDSDHYERDDSQSWDYPYGPDDVGGDGEEPYGPNDRYDHRSRGSVRPNPYPITGGEGRRPRQRPSSQPVQSGSFMGNKTVRIAFYGIMATICIVCVIILVWLMKEKNQQDKDKDKGMNVETNSVIESTVPTTEPTTVETTTEPTETETSEIETTTEDTEQTLAEQPFIWNAEAGDDVYSLCAQFYGSSAEKYAKVMREANPEVFANGDTPAPGARIIQPQMKSAPYYGKTQDEILAMPAPSTEEQEAGEEGTQETGPDGMPVADPSEPETSERQTLPVNP